MYRCPVGVQLHNIARYHDCNSDQLRDYDHGADKQVAVAIRSRFANLLCHASARTAGDRLCLRLAEENVQAAGHANARADYDLRILYVVAGFMQRQQ
jgi:hypothetical protein